MDEYGLKTGSICGVDEAGRGPLAGPVFAAAVILDDTCIEGLADSKQLSAKKREHLYEVIIRESRAYAIASASVEEINELNILNAAMLAMVRAVSALSPLPDMALVDGNTARGFPIPAKTVVKGDQLIPSISAASILAKVSRDRWMTQYDDPGYGFAKHKGYPTKKHYEALKILGPSPIHRKLFIRGAFCTDAGKWV